MYEGMADRAGLTGWPPDGEALLNLTDELMRLPDDHLIQRWLLQQPDPPKGIAREVREAVKRQLRYQVEKVLAEEVAAGRLERHPTDPDSYRSARFAGMAWD
jgi:hypothetical protein